MRYTGQFEAPVGVKLEVITTGDWRTFRPVPDLAKCNNCGICWLFCPTQCIQSRDTYMEPDLDFCKGCGICAQECPFGAIRMIRDWEEGP